MSTWVLVANDAGTLACAMRSADANASQPAVTKSVAVSYASHVPAVRKMQRLP
jgi:hypothetical protein